jgi:hypothetical protein
MRNVFNQRKEKGNWNIHVRLLTILVRYLRLESLIEECRIYPLPSKDINGYKLNKTLSNNIKGRRNSKNILYIGESLENIQEVQELIRGLPYSSLNIYILCLFATK